MKKAWLIALLVAALFAVAFPTSLCLATTPLPPANQVTIVVAPYLTWADITPTATPTLWRLASDGAIGDIPARSRVPEYSEPSSPLEDALTLSAGDWATPDYGAAAAFGASETVAGESASVVYRRVLGAPMGDAAIGYLGLPAATRASGDSSAGIVLGTLGQAVKEEGGSTSAVGNSDAGSTTDTAKFERPAAVVSMDGRGLVDFGDVSADTLKPSAQAPYGRETDVAAFSAALDAATKAARVHSGPSLLALDPGDLYRARRFSWQVTDSVADQQAAEAVSKLDAVVALAVARKGPNDLLVVTSQALAQDRRGALQGFGPIIVYGRGQNGFLVTNTTHRTGVVTNPDITATVLQAFHIKVPVQVIGDVMQGNGEAAPQGARERIAFLTAMDASAVAIDEGRSDVSTSFKQLFMLMLVLVALFAVSRHVTGVRFQRIAALVLKSLALLLMCVPAAAWLMFALPGVVSSASFAVQLLLASVLLLAVIATLLWRFVGGRVPVIFVLLSTVVLMIVDQWLGAPLSFGTYFGYSMLQGARFYGMGNEPAGLVVGAAIVGAALVFDQWAGAAWTKPARRYGLPLLGLVVTVTAVAPSLGANVGVAVWGLAGFAVAWILMNGHRITARGVIVVAVLVVLMIGAFSLVDVFGGGQQTHLGRSISSASQGGSGQLWAIVARKAQTNIRVLHQSSWTLVVSVILGFLVFLRLFLPRDFAKTLAENPAFASAMTATLIAGALAFFTEDSGIVVPGFILLSTAMAAAWLILSLSPAADDEA